MLKQRLSLGPQLAFWITLGFVIFLIAPLFLKESYCPPKGPTAGAIERNGGSPYNEDRGDPVWKFIHLEKAQAENQQRKPDTSNHRWPPTWICEETKFTDFLLAYFTYCLVIVGWFTIRSNERTSIDMRRAYIFGTPQIMDPTPGPVSRAGNIAIEIMAQNYGETPGTIVVFYGEASFNEPAGRKAVYSGGETRNAGGMLQPTKGVPIRLPATFQAGTARPFFFYGYIEYVDLFRKTHISRFCALITPGERGIEAAGSEIWNDWN